MSRREYGEKNIEVRMKFWAYPILAFFLIAPFTPWVDLTLSSFFFSYGVGEVAHFPSWKAFDLLYTFGELPALLAAASASLLYLLSFPVRRLKSWRNPCLYLVLTLAIGAGVLVNTTFKEYWGRPRPKQLEMYGGMQKWRPFWEPNFFHQPEPSKSFPCGHCAMGYFFFSFWFLGRRYKKRWLQTLGLILALGLGIALSIARIAQGGHFFSDTLASALIMWLTALGLDRLIFLEDGKKH